MLRTSISLVSLAILGSMLLTYGPMTTGYIAGVVASVVLFGVTIVTLRRFAMRGCSGAPANERRPEVPPAPCPEKRRAA